MTITPNQIEAGLDDPHDLPDERASLSPETLARVEATDRALAATIAYQNTHPEEYEPAWPLIDVAKAEAVRHPMMQGPLKDHLTQLGRIKDGHSHVDPLPLIFDSLLAIVARIEFLYSGYSWLTDNGKDKDRKIAQLIENTKAIRDAIEKLNSNA
jgi:hypothetical protein